MSLSLEPYSEKAFVVFGPGLETHQGKLTELGGTYNPRLRVGPGFVFPLFRRPQVETFLQSLRPKPSVGVKLLQAAEGYYHHTLTLFPTKLQVTRTPAGRTQYVLTYVGPLAQVEQAVAAETYQALHNPYTYNKRKFLDITVGTSGRLVRYVGTDYQGD